MLDGADVIVGELLRGDVEHLEMLLVLLDKVANRLHEVGLAQSDAAMQEKGIVGPGRGLRDGQRGSMGEPVVLADDERGKSVPGIEAALGIGNGGRGEAERLFSHADRGSRRFRDFGGDRLGRLLGMEDDGHRFTQNAGRNGLQL